MAKTKEFALAHAEKTWQSKETQKKIAKLYMDVAKSVEQEMASLPEQGKVSETLRKEYLYNYSKQLQNEIKRLQSSISEATTQGMYGAAEAVVNTNNEFMNQAGLKVEGAFSYVPTQVIESLVSGKVYKGDWSFSKALWQNTKKTQRDIQTVVARGLAEQKPTYDIAKDLEKYLNPSAKKEWDWSKVYPGTNKKVDYNAQRLARTLIQHSYQLSYRRVVADNPFVEGTIWHSAFSSRSCELCMERDGTIYEKGSEPLDHPQGLCYLEAYIPKSMEQIADELIAWENNEPVSESVEKGMNKYYRSAFGVTLKPDTLKTVEINQQNFLYEYRGALDKVTNYATLHNLPEDFIDTGISKIIQNNSFRMRQNADALTQILENPEIGVMNQLESMTSSGTFNIEKRKQISAYLFGTKNVDKLKNFEFEKYGYLGSKDAEKDIFDFKSVNQYGLFSIEFKKDKIFNNTTITLGDSGAFFQLKDGVACNVSNPTIACTGLMKGLSKNVNETNILRFYENLYKNGDKQDIVDLMSGEYKNSLYRYVELQYHGNITPDLIKSISYPEGEEVPERLIDLCKKHRIPLKAIEK